ncbi:hypothetical protein DSL72_006320 [Monilinia vaccinii-corymbosi]|uniref:Uncharacterized protein n=1 Tax=Monilinia vaccinii-corymbosi TaxID=61207 RepID=A0A8A3PNI3_9HELO|nr:hypothetical protein DSL72_006320 [Monilinia vaccinii-corymbosi]
MKENLKSQAKRSREETDEDERGTDCLIFRRIKIKIYSTLSQCVEYNEKLADMSAIAKNQDATYQQYLSSLPKSTCTTTSTSEQARGQVDMI